VTTRVAFYAALQQLIPITQGSQTIVFDNVMTNIGNAYDSTTGVFTASTDGVYVFSATIKSSSQGNGYFYFYKNHHFFSCLMWDEEQRSVSTAETIVMELRKGDQIHVSVTSADDLMFPVSGFSTFAGIQLWETAPVEVIVGK